ncbi:MAG: nitroreductase family protein [Lachnospiraceae bacterium]|nr:nitroreductase family protein [Lachnospiraceae bacterium]
MNTYDAIITRRSIRSYESTPVPEELLDKVVSAGLYAPSGVNLQPWFVVAVKSSEEMDRVRGIVGEAAEKFRPFLTERFKNNPEVAESTIAFLKTLGGAPACILIFRYKPDYGESEEAVSISIGAAIENMLVAARALGLGSICLTGPVKDCSAKMNEIYAPDKGRLTAIIPVGYPAEEPTAPARKAGRSITV